MDAPAHGEPAARETFTVLVTGANSGLGFAICCRLINEFLFTRPQSQTLHVLYSTRDVRKSEDTSKRLHAHLQKALREANGRTFGISLLLEGRVKIEGVLVDLLKLTTVKALAEGLLRRGQRLDAVIWNAGIAGWKGVNWPKAVWEVVTGIVQATTYPEFMTPDIGLLAKSQITGDESTPQNGSIAKLTAEEPKLGQVFLANVFGHYMLTHWLSPLLTSSSRIIWISSISALPRTLKLNDLQGLSAWQSYEGSKRLTDLLVLTSELPSTVPYTSTFLPSAARPGQPAIRNAPADSRPKIYVSHPGVVGTSIAGLNAFIAMFMLAAMYIARWVGSPWHPVEPYKGAISAAFAALAPPDQLADLELREGKGKWGSATDVFGGERVARTEVEGWGYCGQVGKVPRGCVTGRAGRHPGMKETTKEMREEFEDQGRLCWKQMEEMRDEWERRLGPVKAEDAEDL